MDNLKPVIFFVPLIALILVAVLYVILLKKVAEKAILKRFVIITLVLAFLLNFAWEVIQMPLYKNALFTIPHIAFCALASVADAIMVLLIYFSFALIYKDPLWIQNFSLSRILVLMLVGAIGAVIAEMRHVSAESWSYASSMPIIPIVDVGLSPVLQFMLLPAIIYYLSFKVKVDSKMHNV